MPINPDPVQYRDGMPLHESDYTDLEDVLIEAIDDGLSSEPDSIDIAAAVGVAVAWLVRYLGVDLTALSQPIIDSLTAGAWAVATGFAQWLLTRPGLQPALRVIGLGTGVDTEHGRRDDRDGVMDGRDTPPPDPRPDGEEVTTMFDLIFAWVFPSIWGNPQGPRLHPSHDCAPTSLAPAGRVGALRRFYSWVLSMMS